MLPDGTIEAFQIQALWCRRLGSPLYGELHERCIENMRAGGVVARVLEGWPGKPLPDALSLRFTGAVHDLVLAGEAPSLARFYPSVGGTPEWPATWDAFLAVVETHLDFIRERVRTEGVQTNEVNRCAPLLGGFLRVAAETGRPLRLLELGASAGLNLNWDRYRYELFPVAAAGESVAPAGGPPARWGEPGSRVLIRADWEGPLPPVDASLTAVERAGCDVAPIDLGDAEKVRKLESFVWPDHVERLAQLRAAIDLARCWPPPLERASAPAWLSEKLASERPGAATVVFHSILWWYLTEADRAAIEAALKEAGARATRESPLAWLRMEVFSAEGVQLWLRLWPGGEEKVLAKAHPHGRSVSWLR